MWKCSFCDFTTESLGKYAGHRSGHVRRGELAKGSTRRRKSDGRCKICGKQFSSGQQVAGHYMQAHKPFENLKGDASRKTRLIEERGRQCEVCKLTTWMGKDIPIELDHIDGDPTNNVKANFRLICPNCHAQTDTHAGKNVGRPKCAWRDIRRPNYRKHGSVVLMVSTAGSYPVSIGSNPDQIHHGRTKRPADDR